MAMACALNSTIKIYQCRPINPSIDQIYLSGSEKKKLKRSKQKRPAVLMRLKINPTLNASYK